MNKLATEFTEKTEMLREKALSSQHFSLFTFYFSLLQLETGSLARYAKNSSWLTAVFLLTFTILQTVCKVTDNSW